MTDKKLTLENFVFAERGKTIVETPVIVEYDRNRELYYSVHAMYSSMLTSFRNSQLLGSKSRIYSHVELKSPLDAVNIDFLVRPYGVRVATPGDFADPYLIEKVNERYSLVISRALVFDRTLWKKAGIKGSDLVSPHLADNLAQYGGKNRNPALMMGFSVIGCGKKLEIVPDKEFKVIYDDRINEKWDGFRFDRVDENGLPLHLSEKKGKRVWSVYSGLVRSFSLQRDRLEIVSLLGRTSATVALVGVNYKPSLNLSRRELESPADTQEKPEPDTVTRPPQVLPEKHNDEKPARKIWGGEILRGLGCMRMNTPAEFVD